MTSIRTETENIPINRIIYSLIMQREYASPELEITFDNCTENETWLLFRTKYFHGYMNKTNNEVLYNVNSSEAKIKEPKITILAEKAAQCSTAEEYIKETSNRDVFIRKINKSLLLR